MSTNIAEPTEAANLVGMLVQAAREREAATRVPDCIASAQRRLDQAKDAVLAAMRSAPQEPDDALTFAGLKVKIDPTVPEGVVLLRDAKTQKCLARIESVGVAQEPVADDVLQAMDAAIDQVFDHAEQTFAVLVEGLHAQIFGIYSLGDPALSHAALADGGQIHEAVHALIRALPANRLQAKAPETAK